MYFQRNGQHTRLGQVVLLLLKANAFLILGVIRERKVIHFLNIIQYHFYKCIILRGNADLSLYLSQKLEGY